MARQHHLSYDGGPAEDTASSHQSTATNTDEKAPKQPANLRDLPQELLDIIFDYAYANGATDATHIGRSKWETREKAMCRAGGPDRAARVFQHKVNEFMVSKAFFVCAARSHVKTMESLSAYFFISVSPAFAGIVPAFTFNATARARIFKHVVELPFIRFLRIKVDAFDLDRYKTGLVWRDVFTSEDVRDLGVYRTLTSCLVSETLRRVEVCSLQSSYGRTEAEMAMWRQNVKVVEDTVNEALQSKPTTDRSPDSLERVGGRLPLYLGSKVFFAETQELDDTSQACRAADASPTLSAGQGMEPTAHPQLLDADIPDSVSELQQLLVTNGEGLLDWIRATKGTYQAGAASTATPVNSD